MKHLQLGIIAIAALLTLSLTSLRTFVQPADADSYTLVVTHYDVYKCKG